MSLSILPFWLHLPAGYSLSTGTAGTQPAAASSTTPATASTSTANPTSPAPAVVVSISNAALAGTFTADAGDTFQMSGLFKPSAAAGQTIAGYRVALGDGGPTGGGQLWLDGTDVTGQTSFTADKFARLTYVTDAVGSQQSITVAAQTGTPGPNGTLTQEIDSSAVQITANVTGTRSINAMNALVTQPTGADAGIASIAREAAIFIGWAGAAQPSLHTDGNFTAAANETYQLSALFKGSGSAGQSIAGYRVAVGDGGGQLYLNGQPVQDQTNFTADEFKQLSYVTDSVIGSQQSITVVARIGTTQPDGTLTQEIDSPAVQVTANVTGVRSINAMNALSTPLTGADANVASVARQAGIFVGWSGAAQPSLQTVGNFTAAANETYQLSGLFKASASAGQSIAGYRVAVGDGGGQLYLNGQPVQDQTSFTADEFKQLTYVTDSVIGSQQSITVVAQIGTRQKDGTLTQEIDSPAVQITANVTGARSINAMNALSTPLTVADASVASVARQAGIFIGWSGAPQPGLQTVGNFTAAANETYQLSALFKGNASTGQSIAGYRVAVGDGGGQLFLNGQPVQDQTSFTADEFKQLTYVTDGVIGSQQSITVVAQVGTRQKDGTLTQEIDSSAVQITANVTGVRSINAMNALSTPLTGADASVASVARQAGIFIGWAGATRPTLQTDGNFTAAANETYQLSALFQGGASAGQSIAGYRVAVGDGGGQLFLNGQPVQDQTSFTADEFKQLSYVTDSVIGSQQSITVVAQVGTRQKDGTLTQEIDSPAVQIAASVTGTRSINAMNALSTPLTGADAAIASIARQSGIFAGWTGATRPTLQTPLAPQAPVSLSALEGATGSFQTAGSNASGSATDLASFYPTETGSSASPGVFASPGGPLATALMLLGDVAPGAFQTADDLTAQALAIRAYNASKTL